jgi:TRAP-type C4-dicarboxylate transport system permease small subunit
MKWRIKHSAWRCVRYRTELRLPNHSLLARTFRSNDAQSMFSVLKAFGFLLIFFGLLWFGHFGLMNAEETLPFALEATPLPIDLTSPAPSLVWASVFAIVVGGALVVGGFLLIGRIKNAQLRAEAQLNKRFSQQ